MFLFERIGYEVDRLLFVDRHIPTTQWVDLQFGLVTGCRGVSLPVVLDLSNTLCGDEQIRKIAKCSRRPLFVALNSCPIADVCLPDLETIAPKNISIQGTQITAKGLLSASLPMTEIVVDSGHFTAEEMQQLRARKFQVTERRPAPLTE